MTNEPKTPATAPAIVAVTASDTPVQKQDNTPPALSAQEKSVMLNDEIKKAWSKLSDEDVKLQETQPDQFFAKLREKHNVTREDAQKRLKEIKASCGACTAEKAA